MLNTYASAATQNQIFQSRLIEAMAGFSRVSFRGAPLPCPAWPQLPEILQRPCSHNGLSRSNWPGARREGGSASAAILDRLSNEAPGQFQRNPEGGMSFGRRRCCSLLTDPLRDMLWCPCGSTSRLASAQNPLPRMYSYFGH